MKRYESYKDSGVEWIGEIPSHWNVSRFKYLTSKPVQYGLNIGSDSYLDWGVRLIRTSDISDDSSLITDGVYVSRSDIEESQITTRGDFLLSRSGTIGRVYVHTTDDEHTFAGYLVRFNFQPYSLQTLIKYFCMSSMFFDWLGINTIVSTIGNVNGQKYNNLEVPLPPLPEQEQIVSFLDEKTSKIDDLIKKKEQKIELLKEYRTSLINRVITKGLNPDVPMKDSGVEWIGEIPSHWEVSKVKYQFGISGGGTPSTEKDEYWEGTIPWVSSKDMKSRYIYDTIDHITPLGLQNSTCSLVEVGSIIIVVRSGILQRTIPIGMNKVPLVVNQDQKVLSSRGDVLEEFFYYFVSGNEISLLTDWMKEGTTVESIEMEYLENFPLHFPPLPEQEQIVSYLDHKTGEIDSTIDSEKKKIDLLKEYRQSLISSVITGKIKVVN
jgi:type I restriction enzyme S subunit